MVTALPCQVKHERGCEVESFTQGRYGYRFIQLPHCVILYQVPVCDMCNTTYTSAVFNTARGIRQRVWFLQTTTDNSVSSDIAVSTLHAHVCIFVCNNQCTTCTRVDVMPFTCTCIGVAAIVYITAFAMLAFVVLLTRPTQPISLRNGDCFAVFASNGCLTWFIVMSTRAYFIVAGVGKSIRIIVNHMFASYTTVAVICRDQRHIAVWVLYAHTLANLQTV